MGKTAGEDLENTLFVRVTKGQGNTVWGIFFFAFIHAFNKCLLSTYYVDEL